MGQDDAKCSLRASILRLNAYYGLKAKTAWCCEFSHVYEHLMHSIWSVTRSEEEDEAFRGDLISLPVNHVNVIPARRPRDVRDVCGE